MTMRSGFKRKTSGAAALFLAVAAAGTPAALRASTKTWDLDASGHNDGLISNASGTWDTVTSNWTTNSGLTNTLWTSGDDAIFGGNTGVGVASTITVSGT